MLTSMGVSWFKSEAGHMFSLKVPKRSAVSTARTALNMDLVQEERNFMDARTDIVEVSPFGVWALHLPGISEHLPHLQEIRFVFVGTARHSPDMRVAIRRYGELLLEGQINEAQAAKGKGGAVATASLPLLPFDVDVEDAFYTSPAGLGIREAVKMRLVEDAVFSAQYPAA
jgi:hypothetical protein